MRAVADRPGPLRARALLDLAGLDYWGEGSRPAVARCEQALAAAAGDPALEAACHAELAVYCDFDAARCERHARTALDLLDAEGDAADPDTLIDALLATARASLLLGRGLPSDLIERAFECESQSRRRASIAHGSAAQLGQWLKYVDDFAGSRARLEEALSQAVAGGGRELDSRTCSCTSPSSSAGAATGRWRHATPTRASSSPSRSGRASAARRRCARSSTRTSATSSAPARPSSRACEVVEEKPIAVPLYLRALGFLELSLGDAAAAERHLSRTVEHRRELRHPRAGRLPSPRRPDRGPDRHRASSTGPRRCSESSRREAEQAGSRGRSRPARAAAGCCSRLTASSTAAERSLEDALAEHERLPMPFERGRTLLVLGLLAAAPERAAPRARVRSEQALAIFEELGAPLWAARARRELRPLGGRPTSHVALTPAEQRVAELAASGLTNRQVAAALFISPKTVESSLARAYRKLEIRSRAELGAHIAVIATAKSNWPSPLKTPRRHRAGICSGGIVHGSLKCPVAVARKDADTVASAVLRDGHIHFAISIEVSNGHEKGPVPEAGDDDVPRDRSSRPGSLEKRYVRCCRHPGAGFTTFTDAVLEFAMSREEDCGYL